MKIKASFLGLMCMASFLSFQTQASSNMVSEKEDIKMADNKNTSPSLNIVDIDASNKDVLTTPVSKVEFPLANEDTFFIEALKDKVKELGAAGLAAPQVGMAKAIIAFEVSEEALKLRSDITHLVPLTVLLNPSYEPVEDRGLILDWEGCFSADKHYGKVLRYQVIHYKGFTPQGEEIKGVAVGFLARLLQHEIDHCNGVMCITKYIAKAKSPQGTLDEIKSLRKEELKVEKAKLGLDLNDPFPLYERGLEYH